MDSNDLKIMEWFKKYQEKKELGTLYAKDDFLPSAIITLYFQSPSKINFDRIYTNFKKKYIYNENEVESVKNLDERTGLGVVYDYIQGNSWQNFNDVHVLLFLHQMLYSKTNYKEFGGKFRESSAFISNSDVTTSESSNIPKEINDLGEKYNDLINVANEILSTNDSFRIIEYIDKCIALKTRLVEIHPFPDGNGRTCRAFLNIMFKRVNLPPVYVEKRERGEYIKAMDQAIRQKDNSLINSFYHYKLCDSIMELDINERDVGDNKEINR